MPMLRDGFGRVHDYLRISLTDACNFRCKYCIPDEDHRFMPQKHLMQADEIARIAAEFVKLGVSKIRLTGGEPLVRKDAASIIHNLSKLPVELTLTTNGSLVHGFVNTFKEAGIRSVNLSLDSLDPVKFLKITQRNSFEKVWQNIELLVAEDFHVKLNVVVMRGFNDNEILNFIGLTKLLPLHVRFIEFMPFSGNKWAGDKMFSYNEILEVAQKDFSFFKMEDEANATAKKFKPHGHQGTFAVISTMSEPFCGNCNRMRLTADGKMKNCLFSKGEADILGALRKGQDIVPMIRQCVAGKAKALGGQFTADYEAIDASKISNRSMIKIGG